MFQTCKMAKVIMIMFSLTLLSSCSNAATAEYAGNTSEESSIAEDKKDILVTNEHGKRFLDEFSQTYPDFELIEYVVGSDENRPIELVAIAKNKNDNSSSTLFIVDHNGIGQVVLASEYFAAYRNEDGLVLDKNIISVSLDLLVNNTNTEIHDFEISVTQEEKQGKFDTLYSSKEVIRTKQ